MLDIKDMHLGVVKVYLKYLSPDDCVCGEVGEVAGGVGGVAGHQLVAPGHPPVALDIPVDTLLHTGTGVLLLSNMTRLLHYRLVGNVWTIWT